MKKTWYAMVSMFLLLTFALSGCGKSATSAQGSGSKMTSAVTSSTAHVSDRSMDTTYTIQSAEISQGKIKILYPQLSGMTDTEKQTAINAIIKKDIYDKTVGADLAYSPLDQINYDVKYQVTLENTRILSVFYTGYSEIESAPHPNAVAIGTTVDLKLSKIVGLPDLVTVDTAFAEKVLADPDMTYLGLTKRDATLNDALNQSVELGGPSSIIDTTSAFYLTPDSLVISISIPHAIGDYALAYLSGPYAARYAAGSTSD